MTEFKLSGVNKKCAQCLEECKQFKQVHIHQCPHYTPKDAKIFIKQEETDNRTPIEKPVEAPESDFVDKNKEQAMSPEERQIWAKLRHKACLRTAYKCEACGVQGNKWNTTAHHMIPRRDGGTDDLENLMCLCESCHNIAEDSGMWTRRQIRNYILDYIEGAVEII